MSKAGLSFATNPNLTAYLLTVLGATLPIALGGGLVYRMGRVFELRRPVRTALSAAVVLGTGLLSYGVVLNSHGLAAALVLCATGCLIHVTTSSKPAISGGWLAIGGFSAALAAVIEPIAVVFLVLLMCVPLAMRWRGSLRVGGLLLMFIGATPPLVLHAALNMPVTGDLLPGRFHRELLEPAMLASAQPDTIARELSGSPNIDRGLSPFDAEDARVAASEQARWSSVLMRNVTRVWSAFAGAHGVFSHFPVIVFGIIGVFGVMHRHWPAATKFLAGAALASVLVVVVVSTVSLPDTWSAGNAFIGAASPFGESGMFGPEPFLVFLPVLLFWSGAWLRKPHRLGARIIAGLFLAFSAVVTLVGASDPFPREGYDSYSVAEALEHLLSNSPRYEEPPIFASGRLTHDLP
jgi:hypothetical protein